MAQFKEKLNVYITTQTDSKVDAWALVKQSAQYHHMNN